MIADGRVLLRVRLPALPLVGEDVAGCGLRIADIEDRGPMRHAGSDRADAVLHQPLGERDAFALGIVRGNEVDAESRQVARRGAAIDVEHRDAGFEQPPSQFVLDHAAGANRRFVHDQVARRDAERKPIAQRNRASGRPGRR